jgi:hypothetical protein
MRHYVKPALGEIVRLALFFAAAAVLIFGMVHVR